MMKRAWQFLAKHHFLIDVIPMRLRAWIRERFSLTEYDRAVWDEFAPNTELSACSDYEPAVDIRLGIFEEPTRYYRYFIGACEELRVPYEAIDIWTSDWLEKIRESNCDAFLVWPPAGLSVWKDMFDSRLYTIERELHLTIYPSWEEVWLYERKCRQHYWLKVHGIPHPRTWVFYDEDQTLEFVRNTELPIVLKTDFGAAGNGVYVLHDRSKAKHLVRKTFTKGITPRRHNPKDRQWGYVYLQEYIPHDFEWRVVRIGSSFMVRKKIRVDQHASGSGEVIWAKPSEGLLDFSREVTDIGGFTSVALDIFEHDGELLVNEVQALFGNIQEENRMVNDRFMGRYKYNGVKDNWEFEHGYFYDNACANLRIRYLLQLNKQCFRVD